MFSSLFSVRAAPSPSQNRNTNFCRPVYKQVHYQGIALRYVYQVHGRCTNPNVSVQFNSLHVSVITAIFRCSMSYKMAAIVET